MRSCYPIAINCQKKETDFGVQLWHFAKFMKDRKREGEVGGGREEQNKREREEQHLTLPCGKVHQEDNHSASQ